MKRALLLGALLLGGAQGAGIKVRPQGDALVQAVQAAIAQLSSKDVPMTLDSSSGPTMTLGGIGVSEAPFNPDAISRVVLVGSERRIEINPQGPVPLAEAVKQTLMTELKLKEWTPAAAQQRFGGADLNSDGGVDLADLALLMANFGSTTGAAGDLNQDRKVDDADLRIFSALYSKALAEPPAPAPATTPAPPATPGATSPGTPAPGSTSSNTPTPTTPSTPAPGTPAGSPPASPAPSPVIPTPTTPGTTAPAPKPTTPTTTPPPAPPPAKP